MSGVERTAESEGPPVLDEAGSGDSIGGSSIIGGVPTRGAIAIAGGSEPYADCGDVVKGDPG